MYKISKRVHVRVNARVSADDRSDEDFDAAFFPLRVLRGTALAESRGMCPNSATIWFLDNFFLQRPFAVAAFRGPLPKPQSHESLAVVGARFYAVVCRRSQTPAGEPSSLEASPNESTSRRPVSTVESDSSRSDTLNKIPRNHSQTPQRNFRNKRNGRGSLAISGLAGEVLGSFGRGEVREVLSLGVVVVVVLR